MISSKFEFLYRGFNKTLVLIPGWAFDCRIFNSLNLDYNYIVPLRPFITDFVKELDYFLGECRLSEVSLFGWSLGGFLAIDFASVYPSRVDEVIAVSIRKTYDLEELTLVEIKLKKNISAFLREFYFTCFSLCDRDALKWFRKNILKDYLNCFGMDDLISGLKYLSSARISPSSLCGVKKIRIFHGQEDRVAPFEEVQALQKEVNHARLILIPEAGHIPFLNPNFRDRFNDE
jgi:pimeloyl-ACP methyl ester carboxylesterase